MEFPWQHWLWLVSTLAAAASFLAVRPRTAGSGRWVTGSAALVVAAVVVEILSTALGWGSTRPIPEFATVVLLVALGWRLAQVELAQTGREPSAASSILETPEAAAGLAPSRRTSRAVAEAGPTAASSTAYPPYPPRPAVPDLAAAWQGQAGNGIDALGLVEHALVRLRYALAIVDLEGKLVFANEAWARLHGQRVDDILGHRWSLFHNPDQLESQFLPLLRQAEASGSHAGPVARRRADGSTFESRTRLLRLEDDRGAPLGWVAAASDPQAEGDEAVRLAYLAREVAHGLNNVLSAIVGGAGLLLERQAPVSEIRQELEEIEAAAMRAAELTGKLQAEARRVAPDPRPPTLADRGGADESRARALLGSF